MAGYLAAISVAHHTGHSAAITTSTSAPVATGLAVGVATSDTGAANAAIGISTENPAWHEMVGQVLAGIRRHPTVTPARRRTALRPADLTALLAPLGRRSPWPMPATRRCC